jgi:hypothetical protein
MLTRRSARVLLAPLAMGVALFSLTGCGVGVGDHIFYRVAVDAQARQAGCWQNNMVPDSMKDDKIVNLAGGATFILYIAGDKEAELDTGTIVVGGAETDSGYKFNGQVTNVEYPLTGVTVTELTKITIDMTIDGSTMNGKNTTITSQTCSPASMCPGGFNTNTCTETTAFKGVEIDDALVVVGNSAAPKP